MSAQIPDAIIVDGEPWGLCNMLLPKMFSRRERPKLRWSSTALMRGYFATWEVVDGRLFLKEIADWDELFPDQPAPLFASKITGNLRLVQGKVVRRVRAGFFSTWEREMQLIVNSGIVDARREIERFEPPPLFQSRTDL